MSVTDDMGINTPFESPACNSTAHACYPQYVGVYQHSFSFYSQLVFEGIRSLFFVFRLSLLCHLCILI